MIEKTNGRAARCAVSGVFSAATYGVIFVAGMIFRSLDASGDAAARRPYQSKNEFLLWLNNRHY